MSDSVYKQAFEHTTAKLAIHEPGSAQLATVNRAYATALGYDPSTLEGQSLIDLNAGDETGLETTLERALDGHRQQIETILVDSAGARKRVTLELESVPNGDSRQVLSWIRSVEGREDDTEATATTLQRRLELALSGTKTGVWEWNLATDEVVWTESMEQLFGLEPGTFEGTYEGFAKRVHPDDLPAVEAAIQTAVEQNDLSETEFRIEREDGEQRWMSARGKLQDSSGEAEYLLGIMTDITGQKRQERQYRELVERLPEAYYTITSDWRVSFCNEALADRLGTSVEEIQGELIWEILPETKGSTIEWNFRRVLETGNPVKFEYEYESGNRVVSIQAYPYDDGIAAVSADISARRRALHIVLDAAPIALYRIDADGIFREARGDVLSRLNIDPDDVLGESIFEVYAGNEQAVTAARRALDGESLRSLVTVEDTTLETHYEPVYTNGEVTGAIGVSMDVTELQRQRERMEFFNSILRHDVLNGMTVIKMRAELLAEELEGEQAQYARTILDWCNMTTEVTKRVRKVVETLASPDEEEHLEPVNVSAILDRKVQELETAYPEITFESSVPKDVHVQADELLADVLGNVLTNSVEHNDTTDLRIETTVEQTDGTIQIRVADNGTGIIDDRKHSVFKRGESSRMKETGSGFGLFFVDVLIDKYGGEIRVEDSEDGGACFVIELTCAGGSH